MISKRKAVKDSFASIYFLSIFCSDWKKIKPNSQPTLRPASFYTSTSNGSMVQLLRKNVQSVGAGKILKVMSGDKLDIKVDYYIPTATTDNSAANGLNSIITSLTTIINTDPVTTSLHGSGGAITTALNNSTPFTSFLAPQNGTAGTTLPKAYLNIVFFDEQFKFVSQNSEVIQVTTEGTGQTIYRVQANAKTATKNGFVYIYVSNESNNLGYFDNLQITHEHGPLVQEDHYYPYGLGMAGISSSAISGIVANAYKANGGTELGSGEWSDGKGLELYETTFRSFDAQIGRFMQVDPLMESSANFSGYAFGGDNPSIFVDPSGLRLNYNIPAPPNLGTGDNPDPDGLWDDGEVGSKGLSRSIAGLGLVTSVIEGATNPHGWQNHNPADVIINGATTVATFIELSNPVGWAILGAEGLYFIGNEIYKNHNKEHKTITESLFD